MYVVERREGLGFFPLIPALVSTAVGLVKGKAKKAPPPPPPPPPVAAAMRRAPESSVNTTLLVGGGLVGILLFAALLRD